MSQERLLQCKICIWGPLYSNVLTLIRAWISNYMPSWVWDKITYPFPNFNGEAYTHPWSGSWFIQVMACRLLGIKPWTSYQIRKIAGCACAGKAGDVFPRRRFKRKPLVSDPGMHHGTCVTHVPWCMSGSLTCGDGENVPDIPGTCAPAILRIGQEAHCMNQCWLNVSWVLKNKLQGNSNPNTINLLQGYMRLYI